MDIASFFILFAPLILLYTYTPNELFSVSSAGSNLVWVVLSTALLSVVALVVPIVVRKPRSAIGKNISRNPWFAYLFTIILVFLFAGLVEVFDWIETFGVLFFAPDTFLVADLLLLLPFLIPFLVFRTTLAHRTLLARGLSAPVKASLDNQLRSTVVLLGPQLLYLNTYAWLVVGFEPSAELIQENPWLSFVVVGLLIFLLLTYSPYFVRVLYRRVPFTSHPASGHYREAFQELSARSGVALDRVYVWLTGSAAVANAAVSGAFKKQRTVFLTDRILEVLTPEEIKAVVAHELGHAHHRHLLLMLPIALLSSVFVLWGLYFLENLTWLGEGLGAVVIVLQFVYLALVFRPMAQRFEYQSDIYAAWLMGSHEQLSSALLKLGGDSASARKVSSLTHPSVMKRVQRLNDVVSGAGGDLAGVIRGAKRNNYIMAAAMIVAIVASALLSSALD